MIAFALAVLLATPGEEFSPAYSPYAGEICVDAPEGLVDWGALVRKKLGKARADHPDKVFLRMHTSDYGPELEFRAAPTAAVTARPWNVLHENGSYRLQPESLLVRVGYDVDDDLNLRKPPTFSGEICGRQRSIHAAFVSPESFQLLGEAKWGLDVPPSSTAFGGAAQSLTVRQGATYTFLWGGGRYHYKSPINFKIKRASVFQREDGKRFFLILWEGGCEWDFSLFEVSGAELLHIADNDSVCD
jgi:hypothetical protein